MNTKIVQTECKAKGEGTTLKCIEHALSSIKKTLDDLKGLGVVVGKGSFTSTRIAVTVANTLAFAKGIPVVAVADSWTKEQLKKALGKTPVGRYVSAAYSGEPNVGNARTNL